MITGRITYGLGQSPAITTGTLAAYMAGWAAKAIANPGSLPAGTSPQAAALVAAEGYCVTGPGLYDQDCINGDPGAVAQPYGDQVAAALGITSTPIAQTWTTPTGPSGAKPTITDATIDTNMANFVVQGAAGNVGVYNPAGGLTPQEAALQFLEMQCAYAVGAPSCGSPQAMDAVARQYGDQLEAQLVAKGGWTPKPVTVGSGVAPSPQQPVTIVNPATLQPVTISPASVTAIAAPALPPVVVNPSPPSQPVTTGSSVASPASVSSVANGASLSTDFIAGIPNEWLVFGAAGLAVLLLLAGKR